MSEEEKSAEVTFRDVPVDPNKRDIKRKLSMIQSFASSLASRNFNNKKINEPIKQLRVLSCFGNQNFGGILPPCEHLLESKTGKGKHHCGACGCGDKKGTWLIQEADNYSKLDYPKVACPLQMPGFTNYVLSTSDEADEPVTRKYYIENIDYELVKKVPVRIGQQSEPKPIDDKKIDDLLYIMNPKCGWCKKSDPVVAKLVEKGYKITTLNVGEPSQGMLAQQIKANYNVQCGTPLFINKENGNMVCGFREEDILEKWAKGEKIPASQPRKKQ